MCLLACYESVPKSLQCVCLLPKGAYNVLAMKVSLNAYNVSNVSLKRLQCAYHVLAYYHTACLLKDYNVHTMCLSLKACNVSACMSPKYLLKDYNDCLDILPKCLVCSQTSPCLLTKRLLKARCTYSSGRFQL